MSLEDKFRMRIKLVEDYGLTPEVREKEKFLIKWAMDKHDLTEKEYIREWIKYQHRYYHPEETTCSGGRSMYHGGLTICCPSLESDVTNVTCQYGGKSLGCGSAQMCNYEGLSPVDIKIERK